MKLHKGQVLKRAKELLRKPAVMRDPHLFKRLKKHKLTIQDWESTIETGAYVEEDLNQRTGETSWRIQGKGTEGQTLVAVVEFPEPDLIRAVTIFPVKGRRR